MREPGYFGITMVFAGGIRGFAKKILDGELDAYRVQPKYVLLQILISIRDQGSGQRLANISVCDYYGEACTLRV